MNFSDNFFKRVEKKTNVDKNTILDLADKLQKSNMKDEKVLKERLIRRKQKGGLTLQESKKWYQQVDKVNVETIKNNSIESDCLIRYDGNHYHLLKI